MTSKDYREFARELLERSGLSRARFATAVGVSKNAVDKWVASEHAVARTPGYMAQRLLDSYEKRLIRLEKRNGNDSTGETERVS